jgi:hypothetical protein
VFLLHLRNGSGLSAPGMTESEKRIAEEVHDSWILLGDKLGTGKE